MTSGKPYFIRAVYSWIIDNGLTPHLLVDVSLPGTDVPMQSAENGRILLNISPNATSGLVLGNDLVTFSARFSGVSRAVRVPMAAILAVYARENGQGMAFESEQADATAADTAKRPVLTFVK